MVRLNCEERKRAEMMAKVERDEITDLQAAVALGLSIKHTRRLLARYQMYGPGGLAHGNRNRKQTNAPDSSVICRAEGQAGTDYSSPEYLPWLRS